MRKVKCSICDVEFETKARNQKYCTICKKIAERKHIDNYRRRKGVKVGIGSGNAQGSGKSHHTYKNGIGSFRDKKLKSMNTFYCERCNKDLSDTVKVKSKKYLWCVHHIDGNRENNELSNLELLCKRCHQLEHNCESNLPQNLSKV